MKETQRFLRYVTPGLVFLAETLLLLVILRPDWTVAQLGAVRGGETLGVVFATLLASGGVGFIFSVLHHVIHWGSKRAAIDHTGLIRRLRAARVIELLDASTGTPIPADIEISRADAWVIGTSLWHERLTTSEQLKAAEPKAEVLADMIHTTGTARVGSAVAWAAALIIAASVSRFSLQTAPVICFLGANVLGALLLWMHDINCARVTQLAQGVIEEVLHDGLLAEKEKPIKTSVVLRNPGAA